MNPMKFLSWKNRLGLLILPPLLSLSLISIVKPSGSFAFVIELAIICLCSFICSFVLAVKSFKTIHQRVWSVFQNYGNSRYQLPTNAVVWKEQIIPNWPAPRPAFGFYIKHWHNPFPDKIVTSINFEPVKNYSSIFLVAITLQPTKK